MRSYIAIGVVWILSLLAVGYFIKEEYPTVIQQTKIEQAEIDEDLWVKRSLYQDREDLLASVKEKNKKLEDQISKKDGVIVSYVEAVGKLKEDVDSLKNTRTVENKDTSYTQSQNFFNDLIRVDNKVNITRDSVSSELSAEQIRVLKVDVATLAADDNSWVDVYVHSPDLELNYNSRTELKPERISKWEWFFYGLAGGGLTTLIITQ